MSRPPAELANYDELGPAQQLVLEVLSARVRLGEHIWTFSSRQSRPIKKLEDAGWVWVMHGVVEHSIRAGLTDAAKKFLFLDSTYVSPLEQENIELADQNESLRKLVFNRD